MKFDISCMLGRAAKVKTITRGYKQQVKIGVGELHSFFVRLVKEGKMQFEELKAMVVSGSSSGGSSSGNAGGGGNLLFTTAAPARAGPEILTLDNVLNSDILTKNTSRRDFFKSIFTLGAGAVVAPQVALKVVQSALLPAAKVGVGALSAASLKSCGGSGTEDIIRQDVTLNWNLQGDGTGRLPNRPIYTVSRQTIMSYLALPTTENINIVHTGPQLTRGPPMGEFRNQFNHLGNMREEFGARIVLMPAVIAASDTSFDSNPERTAEALAAARRANVTFIRESQMLT